MEENQRNVILTAKENEKIELAGKPFPCPLCSSSLAVRLSQKEKPYCVSNDCGFQLFSRGKTGIRRLQTILESEKSLHAENFTGVLVCPFLQSAGRFEGAKKQIGSQARNFLQSPPE